MAKLIDESDPDHPAEIDLRNPTLAAMWAWLWPGAGHIYQRRYGKAILFMVCILSTYFFGLALGGGHVVYASFKKPDVRYPYICQIGVGLPALPALVQYNRVIVQDKAPLFAVDDPRSVYRPGDARPSWQDDDSEHRKTAIMAPPQPVAESMAGSSDGPDQLADWHKAYHTYFELGTLYTMVAGLLNVLAIYDAFAGPAFPSPDDKRKKPPSDKDQNGPDAMPGEAKA